MDDEQRPPSRIPDFKSREEEAEFWDTHDFMDFWDELEPVKLEVSPAFRAEVEARVAAERADPRPLIVDLDPLIVDLDPVDRAKLERRAREGGVGPAALALRWLEERLDAVEEEPDRLAG